MLATTINRLKRNSHRRSHATALGDDVLDDAADYSLQRVDEASAAERPPGAGKLYVESEYDARSAQQPKLHIAEGEMLARPHAAVAASLRHQAKNHEHGIKLQRTATKASASRYEAARAVLHTYTHRASHDKAYYLARMVLLLVGDIVGCAGAAIMLGEIPWMAVVQAAAVGAAAVTSGLIAAEVKDSRLARKRQKDENTLSKNEKPYAHLFRGADPGEQMAWRMAMLAMVIVFLILGGIFALRSTTEGVAAGAVYGCLAAAVALASWINSYVTADEVADMLDRLKHDFDRDLAKLHKLTAKSPRTKQIHHQTMAASIRHEFGLRGRAGSDHFQVAKYRTLVANPGVAGHGAVVPVVADSPPTAERSASIDTELIDLQQALSAKDDGAVHAGYNGNGAKDA